LYPHERSLVEELAGQPFALVGVNSDSSVEVANKAIEENGLNWRSFQNERGEGKDSISTDWYVQGWPTIVVLDAEMKVRYRGHDGHAATDVAKKLLAELTAQKN
jgi:hypothetical protein